MMMCYSAAAMIVDKLESHAEPSMSESEIEAGRFADVQVTGHPSYVHGLGAWIRVNWSRLLGARNLAAVGGTR